MSSSERPPLAEVRFLTVAEVAAMMRVSKMTVYRLVHSGELPALRVGRSFRVPEHGRPRLPAPFVHRDRLTGLSPHCAGRLTRE